MGMAAVWFLWMIRIIVGTAQHALELEQCVMKVKNYYGDREFFIKGIDNIVEHLNRFGYVNKAGKPITPATLRKYIKEKKFPAYAMNKADGLLTTNVLIQAWLWSLVNAAWREHKRPAPHAGRCWRSIDVKGRLRCPRMKPCPVHP